MRLMKKTLLPAWLVIGIVASLPMQGDTIGQIENLPSGTQVTLDSSPVITVVGSTPGSGDGYTYSNYAILAADSTGSIDLFGRLPTGSTYMPTVGDAIVALGMYSPFDSIPEIASLVSIGKVSGGNAIPAAFPVTAAQLVGISPDSYNYLGHYLSLQNVIFAGASGNFPVHANGTYTVTDLSGQNGLTLYQWASSYSTAGALGGTPVPTGAVNINGIVDIFNGTPEFIPFSITPTAGAATPEPASLGLVVGGIALVFGLKHRRANL